MSNKLKYGKFLTGFGSIFNPPPTNKKESVQHGNALVTTGNYPVGTSECFNVGIAGGCGINCYIYQDGRCEEPQEMLPLEGEDLIIHQKLYQ